MSSESLVPQVGVGVFVFRDGKFLMGWRQNAHGADTWSIPGGHLEFGESFEDTVRREVREETGMEVDNISFAAVTNDIFPDDNKHYISVWMKCDWKSGEPAITEPDKYIEQRWVTFDDLPQPLFLAWQQLLPSDFIEPLRLYAASTKRL